MLMLLSWATKTIDRLHTKSIEFSQASGWEEKLLKPWMQTEEELASSRKILQLTNDLA